MNRHLRTFAISLLLIIGLMQPVFAFAGGTPPAPAVPSPDAEEVEVAVTTLKNPLGAGNVDVKLIIGRGIQVVMGIVGGLTLLVFIFGGWMWITSAGFPQRVQQGIRTMLFAAAGLFVIFAAYGILSTFINALTSGST